jgi:hypothetical protein
MATGPATGGEIRLPLDLPRLRRVAIGIILALYAVDIPASWAASSAAGFDFDHPVYRFVLLKSERNIPTAYACLQLLACAAAAGVLALLARHDRSRDALRWAGMSAVFVYLTLDEGLGIHEGFLFVADRVVPGAAGFYPAWIAVALVGVVPLLLLYARWVLRLPPRTRRGLLAGGAVYVLGAFGLQAVSGGLRFEHPLFPVVAGLEELAEMTGIAVFGLTLLDLVVERVGDRRLALAPTPLPAGRTAAPRRRPTAAPRPSPGGPTAADPAATAAAGGAAPPPAAAAPTTGPPA